MVHADSLPAPTVVVSARGRVAPALANVVAAAVSRVLARHRVFTEARLRLTGAEYVGAPVLAQVNLMAAGAPVRVQIAAPAQTIEATVADRLDHQLDRLSRGRRAWPWPDPSRPPLASVSSGVVSRRKDCPLAFVDAFDAVAIMNAMDYDAHLFTDAETGDDAVVYRAGPHGQRLARQYRRHPPRPRASLPLTVHPYPTPTLTEDDAVHRLCEHGLPYLFFTDAEDDRGHLVYRRYDGSLGLIRPVDGTGRDGVR